jgi:hypothetical protein
MQEQVTSEILTAHADKMVAGEDAAVTYLHLFPEADRELAELMALAARIRLRLVPVRPTPQFRAELRRDLLAAARQRNVGMPLPTWEVWREDAELWVDYARRHLPDWTPPLWVERRQPPRSLVLAALGLAGAGAWAYWRRRQEIRIED